MGVMACDRTDCENIMCDICIAGRYYVCRDCAHEFKELCGEEPQLKSKIGEQFVQFMATPKSPFDGANDECTVDEFLGWG